MSLTPLPSPGPNLHARAEHCPHCGYKQQRTIQVDDPATSVEREWVVQPDEEEDEP